MAADGGRFTPEDITSVYFHTHDGSIKTDPHQIRFGIPDGYGCTIQQQDLRHDRAVGVINPEAVPDGWADTALPLAPAGETKNDNLMVASYPHQLYEGPIHHSELPFLAGTAQGERATAADVWVLHKPVMSSAVQATLQYSIH